MFVVGGGILDRVDGSTYDGEFAENAMNGVGTLKLLCGDVFTGTFRNNVIHGHGRCTFANGDSYDGEYVDGRRVGGVMKKPNGSEYVAEFGKNGEVSRLRDVSTGADIGFAAEGADASKQAATEEQGQRWKDGEGSIVYPNGDRYVGFFQNNQRHGYGVLHYANQDKYDGEWQNGLKHGNGKMTWNAITDFGHYKGWRYTGMYANDVFEGHGELRYDTEGGNYSGYWEGGKRQGLGREQINGDVYEGEFVDDLRHGDGVLTHNGNTYKGKFVRGECADNEARINYADGASCYCGGVAGTLRNGEGHMKYADGTTYDGEFQNDLRHGVGVAGDAGWDLV